MLKPPSLLSCVAALLFTFGIAANSRASEDYRCTIERYSRAEGDSGPTYKMVQGAFMGKQFTVDRSTGITIGALKNSVDSKPQVVDRGSKDNSFKVVSAASPDEFQPGSIVSALNVMEFVRGEMKPFNFMINDGVFFGTCEHF
jgi:hypothetical protein